MIKPIRSHHAIWLVAATVGIAALAVLHPAAAQVQATDPTGGYAEAFRKLKGTFRAPVAAEQERSQTEAIEALRQLEESKAISPRLFQFDALREQLKLGNKANLELLAELEQLYYQDIIGVEQPAVLRLREAVGRFRDITTIANLPDASAVFDRKLEETADWLTRHAAGPTAESSYQLGIRLGWLEHSTQVVPQVAEIQKRYSQPNIRVRITKAYIEDFFRKDINEKSPVAQVIRGADVNGVATTLGATHLELLHSDEDAILCVVMTGTMKSDVVATKAAHGPFGKTINVRVPSTGQSTVRIEKSFRLTDSTLTPLPAQAYCQTATTFLGVQSSAKTAFVRHKVVDRAYADKPAGELEAAAKAEAEMRRKADSIPAPPMAKEIQDGYKKVYLDPQIRVGSAPTRSFWSSTPDYLQYNLVRRNSFTLGAPAPAPELHGNHHITVALHQSEATNEIGPLLGNRWITDENLADIYKIIFGTTPKPLRLGSHMLRWSLKFDPIRPLQFEFGGDKVALTIYATELQVGDKLTREPFSVSATYSVKVTEAGVELVRDGELRIATDKNKGDLKTFLFDKFDDVLAKTLAPDGLVPPDGGHFDALRAISITEGRTQDGWALIGLRDSKKK